jgi:cephalosporin hydroxylase
MDILTLLSNKYKCDKSDRSHNYTPLYNLFFENIRDKKLNLLEIGYGEGCSCRMWLDYFSNAKIISVDIAENISDQTLIENPRFEFISSNQIDIIKFMRLVSKYKEFYIVIDDGSHVPEDQQYTFGNFFPFVSRGGFYVIEDLDCKRNHNLLFGHSCEPTMTFLRQIKEYEKISSKVLSYEQEKYLKNNIDEILIFGQIAFIKKKD